MWNGRLPNVKNLTPETAAVLAGFKGPRLDLDGATLSKEALEEVAGYRGLLLLRGLTTLPEEKLAALAAFNGSGLGLGGLTTVTPDLAKRLATFATKFLSLDDVAELSQEPCRSPG
jgi:hypothetical protein